MQFRAARHCKNLHEIEHFYTHIVGLSKLGEFLDHDKYNGIFLGFPDHDWHLEFTESPDSPNHNCDEDDLLVFYYQSKMELNSLCNKLKREDIVLQSPKNPYWKNKGVQINDPEGYPIMFTIKEQTLFSQELLSKNLNQHGISTWDQLLHYISALPYGRNSNRADLSLVLSESKGSCSSKHALVKQIAMENNIGPVELILCIYKMNRRNTPAVAPILNQFSLDYIPEAHCYLKVNGIECDLTGPDSDFLSYTNDILYKEIIKPSQVVDYKIIRHKEFLQDWLNQSKSNLSFDELWRIRELCIQQLSN